MLSYTFTVEAAQIAGLTHDPAGRIILAVRQTTTPGPCNARGPNPSSCLAVYDRNGNALGAIGPPPGDVDATYMGVASDFRYASKHL